MNGADYGPAIQMFVDRSRVFQNALRQPQFRYAIVIHKTACGGFCTAQDVARFFATDAKEASTHYIIGKDGTVVQCVREIDGAGGNCCIEPGYDASFWDRAPTRSNLNLCTFSIEHCDYSSDNSEPMTQQQKDASHALVGYLVSKYGIPISHIKGHNTISPQSRKNCPGNYDWMSLYIYLSTNGILYYSDFLGSGFASTIAGVGKNIANNQLSIQKYILDVQQIQESALFLVIGGFAFIILLFLFIAFLNEARK